MELSQFEKEFLIFQNKLKSFLLRFTANPQDTEDLVQETYLRARHKLHSFRGESSLKTWVFAIGANLARDQLRKSRRWPGNVLDICKEAAMSNEEFFKEAIDIRQNDPQGQYEFSEHIAFCFTCIAKTLPLEGQLCLLLKDIYEFQIQEIASIVETTPGMVKHHLRSARQKMQEIFDGRCALVNKEGICHQCTELNGIFNPKQDQQAEKMKLRLVQDAVSGTKEHLFQLRTEIVRTNDPFLSPAATLQLHHLNHNRQVVERHLAQKSARKK